MTKQMNYGFLFLLLFFAACAGQNQSKIASIGGKQSETPLTWHKPFVLSEFLNIKIESYANAPNNFVRTGLQDKSGNLWFGSWEQGLYTYNFTNFKHFTEATGIGRVAILSMFEDKTGKIWLGTWQHGVYIYDPSAKNGKNFQNFTQKDGLNDNYVYSIFEDTKGDIWLATAAGLCIYKSSADGKNFLNVSKQEGLSTQAIYSITSDKTGKIWFGAEDSVFYYDGSTFHHLKNNDGAAFKGVRSILADKKGNIWLGNLDGLFCYDGKNIKHISAKETAIKHEVWNIYEDSKGNIWFGLSDYQGFGGGLACYNPSAELGAGGTKFTYFTEKEGLLNNRVFCVFEDKKGILWIGTSEGVCTYDGKTFTNYLAPLGEGGC